MGVFGRGGGWERLEDGQRQRLRFRLRAGGERSADHWAFLTLNLILSLSLPIRFPQTGAKRAQRVFGAMSIFPGHTTVPLFAGKKTEEEIKAKYTG